MTIKDNLSQSLANDENSNSIKANELKQNMSHDYDRLYIKDYVIKASVGIHEDEKKSHQRMRFSLEAFITKRAYNDENILADVVDYDFLIKSIHKIMDNKHNNLVEVIAENIAKACLEDARVKIINVTVEKLDRLNEGVLGYQINRMQESLKKDNIYPLSANNFAAE